ncbi:MAG: ATP phosphoribosyltransferase regulatory subunit [Firmicutes bacterium]|nr:ATP phosphoribosyltransferase regulatory subunit [Bacillota bacterium]
MKLNRNINLKQEDINILNLRHLYEQFGYVHYKMNKFEEYDLYVTNKDFLSSDSIITFTDTNGKLLALKPDVTLSIVKNYQDVPETVQKVYYNENIYRTSKSTKTYKEIMQMGLECMGDLDIYQISEVLILAAKSLSALSDNYILDVSHMGIIQGFLEELKLKPRHEEKFLALLREKNVHGIRTLFDSLKICDDYRESAITLASTYGCMDTVLKTLRSISLNETMDKAIDELETISDILSAQGFDDVHLDFSIVNDMSYYNGVLFRGYIDGIPTGVLSGGQYDELMEKMGKRSGAIGFAIYMDLLEDYDTSLEGYDVDVLLLYGKTSSPEALFEAVQSLTSQGYSVQTQRQIPKKLRYRKLMKFENGTVKEVSADEIQ